jgi:hypothetical protein
LIVSNYLYIRKKYWLLQIYRRLEFKMDDWLNDDHDDMVYSNGDIVSTKSDGKTNMDLDESKSDIKADMKDDYGYKKEGESDPLEEVVFFSHLEAMIAFCGGEQFQDAMEDFKREHMSSFRNIAESKKPDEEEHPLEFTEIFNKHQQLMENLLQNFADRHNVDSKELYFQCRDALDGQFCALFEEHRHKWFVDMLLEWQEYSTFIESMVSYTRLHDK